MSNDAYLTQRELDYYASVIHTLPEPYRKEVAELIGGIGRAQRLDAARTKFLPFVKRMWPAFIEGEHHRILANTFERIAEGSLKRVTISLPPRHTKSEFGSYLLPAWFLGRYPDKKVIQASHTAELAVGFGRKVRNLVATPEYQDVFPETFLRSDSKAAGRWDTARGGEYFAIGVGGAVTGKGADLLIIDDPHSEQEAKLNNPDVFDAAYDWYTSGPRQRLQPGGSIVCIMTRWSKRDLIGHLLRAEREKVGGDRWEVIELPAILPSGNPLWPKFWPLDELLKIKAELPIGKWNAQYQQDPTSDEGAIVKREWWKCWEREEPPHCEYVIQSWDTAYTKGTRSDPSACTTWGVFYWDEDKEKKSPNIILLDAFAERLEFPELKRAAMKAYREWKPDSLIIEAKASGLPLVSELRQMGVPVQDFTPTRGNDKIVRVNAVSDLFSSGIVWYPMRKWAEDVVEQFASFPNAEHDDLVDSSTQALLRFRQGGFIALPSDEREGVKIRRRPVAYY